MSLKSKVLRSISTSSNGSSISGLARIGWTTLAWDLGLPMRFCLALVLARWARFFCLSAEAMGRFPRSVQPYAWSGNFRRPLYSFLARPCAEFGGGRTGTEKRACLFGCQLLSSGGMDGRNPTMTDREQLQRDGYALLRQAVPVEWLDDLRTAFDAGITPSNQWPVPRGADWHHSLLDDNAMIQAVCRVPPATAAGSGRRTDRRALLPRSGGRPRTTAWRRSSAIAPRPLGAASWRYHPRHRLLR